MTGNNGVRRRNNYGAVDFGRDGKPWGDLYRRVVQADLALEEWHSVVKI